MRAGSKIDYHRPIGPTSQESRCESLASHWLPCVRRNFLLFTQKFNAFARHASAGVFVLTLSHVRRGIPTAAAVFIPCVHALTQILIILFCSFGMWRIRVFGLRVRLGVGSIPTKEQCNCADDRERTHGTPKHPKSRLRGRATRICSQLRELGVLRRLRSRRRGRSRRWGVAPPLLLVYAN
jgi:hypothetical protein